VPPVHIAGMVARSRAARLGGIGKSHGVCLSYRLIAADRKMLYVKLRALRKDLEQDPCANRFAESGWPPHAAIPFALMWSRM
jgi:hypothetical protein